VVFEPPFFVLMKKPGDMHSDLFKDKAAYWADRFQYCCFLDSNGYADQYGRYDYLIAAGARKSIQTSEKGAFKQLKQFQEEHCSWMFGYLGYNLKNQLEDLKSENQDHLSFPDLFFFVPEYLIAGTAKGPEVLLGNKLILEEIEAIDLPFVTQIKPELLIRQRIEKERYLRQVEHIQTHIHRGDVYEVTFCQEFFAENAVIDPLRTFSALNARSPAPFAGYLKIKDQYILCASPERFLCRRGSRITAQPIKGTAARDPDLEADLDCKRALRNDLKEQTENVMIVDLLRNDLTKIAAAGTVEVTELFGVYSFAQVHQMISTIECTLKEGLHAIDAISHCFPMGSMTGAPKIRAMELIELVESSKRGAYSGAMGYFDPNGDFDLNVVIRSILYNASSRHLSFPVGGAITYASEPLKEYEECLLKASAILETIKGSR
jgi:para-aminobenzoate synthetase component 1